MHLLVGDKLIGAFHPNLNESKMTIKEFIELLSTENQDHEIGFGKFLPPNGYDTEILQLGKTDGKYIIDMRNKEGELVKRIVLLYNPKEFEK